MEDVSMNHYGARARRHWQTHRPQEYGQITDPETFFSDLGNRIATEIDRRRTEQERSTGAGDSQDFLANLQSLNSTAISVEDEVLREMAFTEPGGPV
jgi:hypothetical protein